MVSAWARVTITDRSLISAGWKGSMPSFTPSSAAYGARRSIPASTMSRAASRSRFGDGPQTSTSTAVPRVAASSRARRLSSRRDRRSATVSAGNIPPRHRLETRSPASHTIRALFEPGLGDLVAPEPYPGYTRADAALDGFLHAPVVGGPLVEAEPREIQRRGRQRHLTPP